MIRNQVRRRPVAVGLVILCLFVAMAPVAAQAAAGSAPAGIPLSGYVPAETMMYFAMPSVPGAIEALKKHPLAALYANDEMQAFLAPMLKVLEGTRAEIKEKIGLCPSEIVALMQGSFQFAMVGLTESDEGPQPDFVMTVDCGGRVEDARTLMGKLMDLARETDEVEDVKLGDTPAWRAKSGVLAFFVGNTLVIDSNRARVDRILAGKPGEITPLAASEDYRAVVAKVGAANAHAHYYINIKRLIDTALEASPTGDLGRDQFDKVMMQLGLKDVHSLGAAMNFGERGVNERLFIPLPASRTGILKLFETLKPGLTHPKGLSANTVAYLGKRVDLMAAYDILVDVVGGLLREMDPDSAEEMDNALQQAESGAMGFKLREDLLASLGEEFGLSMGLRTGSWIPDVLLTVQIRDKVKMTSLVEHLRSTLPPDEVTVSKVRVGDYTMLAFKVKQGGIPVTPAVAVLDDTLVAGLFAPTVRRYLRGYKKSLAENPTFQDGLASAGLQDLSTTPVLFYADVRRIIAFAYDNFGPLLSNVDPADLGTEIPGFDQLDFALLPTTEALIRPFKPWVVTAKVDQDGFSTATTGPFTMNSLQLVIGLGASVWMVPRRVVELEAPAEEDMVEEEVVEEEPTPMPAVSLGIGADELAGGGLKIAEIEAGGAAAAAGLAVGDCVTAFDGQPVKSVEHGLAILATKKPGDTVKVTLRRGEQVMTVPVTLKARSPAPAGK